MYVPAELAQHVHTVDGSKPNTQAVGRGRRPWLRLEDPGLSLSLSMYRSVSVWPNIGPT